MKIKAYIFPSSKSLLLKYWCPYLKDHRRHVVRLQLSILLRKPHLPLSTLEWEAGKGLVGVVYPAPRQASAPQRRRTERGAAHRKRVVFGRDCERVLLRLRLRLGLLRSQAEKSARRDYGHRLEVRYLVPEVLFEHREILGEALSDHLELVDFLSEVERLISIRESRENSLG